MKKLSILCCSIFISLCIFCQNNKNDKIIRIYTGDDFCKKLSEIMTHAHTNFEKIKTEEMQDQEIESDIPLISFNSKASLKFPGAKLSSVVPGFGDPDSYSAFFGIYETENIALKKLDSIKMKLAGCLSGYDILSEPIKDGRYVYPVRFLFKEKRTDKIPPQRLKLLIEKSEDYIKDELKDVFKVYLDIDGLKPINAGSN